MILPERQDPRKRVRRRRGATAWLVTWVWRGEHAAVADHVVCVLPPQWQHERVCQTVELLYAALRYPIDELARYAKRPSNNPSRVNRREQSIECGHNPSLEARYVIDLVVDTDDESGLETIRWTEPPLYELVAGEVVARGTATRHEFRRRVRGAPSSAMI